VTVLVQRERERQVYGLLIRLCTDSYFFPTKHLFFFWHCTSDFGTASMNDNRQLLCRDSALWFHDYDEVADAHCFGVASYSSKSLWREQWYFGNLGWHKTRLCAGSYHLFVVTSEHFKVVVDSSHIMVESAFKNNPLSVFIALCIAASNLSQSPLTRQAPFQIFNI